MTPVFLWGAVDPFQRWLDQAPFRDPSLLHLADLEEQCIRLLTGLSTAAVNLLRCYLHRLFLSQALPLGNRSELLAFLGQKFELTCVLSPRAQLICWLSAGSASGNHSQFRAWRRGDISTDGLARFEAAPEAAQRMLLVDIQLRHRMQELLVIPVPERRSFFGRLLDFFSGPPSDRYPPSPAPAPPPKASAPLLTPIPSLANQLDTEGPPLTHFGTVRTPSQSLHLSPGRQPPSDATMLVEVVVKGAGQMQMQENHHGPPSSPSGQKASAG